MVKKISVFLLMLIAALSFSGCGVSFEDLPIAGYSNVIDNFERITTTMSAGETYTVDMNGHFKDSGIDYVWYEFISSDQNAVKVNKNRLTAVDAGNVTVQVVLYEKSKTLKGEDGLFAYYTTFANVYVINEATMTHITTAQELADMNNDLCGNYILKADIDLADWGEWESIGRPLVLGSTPFGFEGMLVNPYGYKIKNLTITASTERESDAGLFNYLGGNSLISGIILEDIFIDVSDCETAVVDVGGITAVAQNTTISNCAVSGVIIGAGSYMGGIAGTNSGYIINCTFNGSIKNEKLYSSYVGGVVGINFSFGETNIKECAVNANINGNDWAIVGGIIGYGFASQVADCSFSGEVKGNYAGTMIGLVKFTNESVDFD